MSEYYFVLIVFVEVRSWSMIFFFKVAFTDQKTGELSFLHLAFYKFKLLFSGDGYDEGICRLIVIFCLIKPFLSTLQSVQNLC